MRRISIRNLALGAMLAGLCCANLSAAPIFGTFNIAGVITVVNGTATTPNQITWKLDSAPFTLNQSRIGPGATGSFSGLDGTIATTATLNSATEPVGTTFTPQPFIGFVSAPSLPTLNINFIFPGIYSNSACGTLPATVGQNCTPNLPGSPSPFNFVNNPPPAPTGPQATATFVFTGVTSDLLSTFQANFTSQFNVPYQTVLANLSRDGFVTNTFSATVTVQPAGAVPEPSPLILTACGLGLVVLSSLRRWRSGRRDN